MDRSQQWGQQNDWLGSSEAHKCRFQPQEDRGGAKETLGEGPGGEEINLSPN
jgi:hypothetical protein